MALINKNTPEIAANSSGRDAAFVSFPNQKDVYFTSAAAKIYGLEPGKYIHFDNTDDKWSFFQSDDKDGFLLHGDAKESSSAVRLVNKALVRMFRKATKYKDKCRFILIDSGAKVGDKPLIEIVTVKTYDDLIKQL